MNSDRRERLLDHARALIRRLRADTRPGRDALVSDPMTQDAVLRNLEITGQLIRDLDPEWLETQASAIPWKRIAGMRNLLAHAYLTVEMDVAWSVIEHDLAPSTELWP